MKRALLVLLLVGCKKPAPPPPPPSATYEDCKDALAKNQLDAAEHCFKTLADRAHGPERAADPARDANVLFALANIRQERNDGKGAVAYAMRAAALRPADLEAQELLVTIARDAGDHTAERAALTRQVELDPDALDARLRLAGLVTGIDGPEAGKQLFLAYEDARIRLMAILGKDPDPTRRRAAARRLSAAKDAGTARGLVLAMTDKDAGVREDAVRSVMEVGVDLDPEIRPALKKMAALETDAAVKTALAEALR